MKKNKSKLYTEQEVIDILVKDMQRRLLQNDFNVHSVFKVSEYMKKNLVFNKCPSRKITTIRSLSTQAPKESQDNNIRIIKSKSLDAERKKIGIRQLVF